jgi:iron complex outermembrane receptor protein
MQIAGVDVQTHWKISKQWQHDFTLAYVNGKTSQTRSLNRYSALNLSNKIQFSNRECDLKLELKSEIVLRQNQFPDNNFTTNIVVNNEVVPVLVDIVRLHQGINCCTLLEMNFKFR